MGTPGRYHKVVAKLAHGTGGRCLLFRHRLAPQHSFPAALLDALICYMSLLHPPRGAFQDPVPSTAIVSAGNSAGANLALALTHILLFARAQIVMFHSTKITLSLPAGIPVLSAGLELILAFPSFSSNRRLDIFPDTWSFLKPDYPTCEIWPSAPPRGHPCCEISMLLHPLVTARLVTELGRPPRLCGSLVDRHNSVIQRNWLLNGAARHGVQVWV